MTTIPASEESRRVLASTRVSIERTTINGLMESFRETFRAPQRVERLLYERGLKYYTVERFVPATDLTPPEDGEVLSSYLTPFEMVRQESELEELLLEDLEPVALVAHAVQRLSVMGYALTMFICDTRQSVRTWFGSQLELTNVWQVPLHEDQGARVAGSSGLFVVGSSRGPMVQDIEAAVFCRFEDSP